MRSAELHIPSNQHLVETEEQSNKLEKLMLLFVAFRVGIEIYLPSVTGLRFLTPLVSFSVIPGKHKIYK